MNCFARLKGGMVALCVAMVASSQAQVALNQIDTFNSGSALGWSGGFGPAQIPSGGVGGVNEGYLQISADGGAAAGGKLATYNEIQWGGQYVTAGVKAVDVYFKHLAGPALTMRIVLFGVNGSRWTSTNANAVNVPIGSNWTQYRFVLKEANFVRVSGTESWNDVINGVAKFMFRHDPGDPTANGQSVVATLGIDSISAIDSRSYVPTLYNVLLGTPTGGSVANLQTSNNVKVFIANDEFDTVGSMSIESVAFPDSQYQSMRVRAETNTSRPGMSVRLDLFNFISNAYDQVDNAVGTILDQTRTVNVTSNLARYIGPAGELRSRIRWIPSVDIDAADGWLVGCDFLDWKLNY